MTAVAFLYARNAEIIRSCDRDGARRWSIEVVAPDGSRETVAERSDVRSILADALALERQGFHVSRAGLAR